MKTNTQFTMSNLYPKRTGLPYMLYVDCLGSARKAAHNPPRLFVQNVKGDKAVDDAFEMSISKTPEILSGECKTGDDLKAVKQYIIVHYNDFMAHWNHEIAEDELKNKLYVR